MVADILRVHAVGLVPGGLGSFRFVVHGMEQDPKAAQSTCLYPHAVLCLKPLAAVLAEGRTRDQVRLLPAMLDSDAVALLRPAHIAAPQFQPHAVRQHRRGVFLAVRKPGIADAIHVPLTFNHTTNDILLSTKLHTCSHAYTHTSSDFGISTGLVNENYWEYSKGYYVNVERGKAANKLSVRNINDSFTNNSKVPIEVMVFMFYSDEISINVAAGLVNRHNN
jgi:hypothetical protein